MKAVFASAPFWVVTFVVSGLATWGGGGTVALSGYGLGAGTAIVSLAGWYAVTWLISRAALVSAQATESEELIAEDGGNASDADVVTSSQAKSQIGTVIVVLAFLIKLPLVFLMASLALRLDGPGPGCFAFGLLLVYSGAALWGVCRTPAEAGPDA